MSILKEIVDYKISVVASSSLKLPFKKLQEKVLANSQKDLQRTERQIILNQNWPKNKLRLIAEIKMKSPSRNVIRSNFDPIKLALDFQINGAWAISVLTDEKYFGGSLEIFRAVRSTVDLPLLRKDFIIDTYQLWESKLIGADIVLLIVGCLHENLEKFLRLALDLNLRVLIEVHTQQELDQTLNILQTSFVDSYSQIMLGINNRNLDTFELDLKTSVTLKKSIPPNIFSVSESGIFSLNDLELLQNNFFEAVLIGEGLAKNHDLLNFFKPE